MMFVLIVHVIFSFDEKMISVFFFDSIVSIILLRLTVRDTDTIIIIIEDISLVTQPQFLGFLVPETKKPKNWLCDKAKKISYNCNIW